MSDDGVSRRELLKKVGLGGAVFLGGSVLGRNVQSRADATAGEAEYEGSGIGASRPAGVHPYHGPIVLGQGQRAMIEFSLPTVGRYMFHPHQHWLADRGARGWFAAI